MKLSHLMAGGGLIIASLAIPAAAQDQRQPGMHQNDPAPGQQRFDPNAPGGPPVTYPGELGGPRSGRGPDGGPDMRDGGMRDRGMGGRRHRHCRTVWRHHHRVKRCY